MRKFEKNLCSKELKIAKDDIWEVVEIIEKLGIVNWNPSELKKKIKEKLFDASLRIGNAKNLIEIKPRK